MNQKQIDLGNEFRKVLGGKNIITENLVRYESIKDGVIELTKGSFMSGMVWGVTVVQNGATNLDLGRCCHSITEANEYIKSLK